MLSSWLAYDITCPLLTESSDGLCSRVKENESQHSAAFLVRTPTLSDQGPVLMTSFNLNHLLRGLVSKQPHCEWNLNIHISENHTPSVHIPPARSGITGSSLVFNFWRNCPVLHRDCTVSHSHQQSTRLTVSLHLHQHLLFYLLVFPNSLSS